MRNVRKVAVAFMYYVIVLACCTFWPLEGPFVCSDGLCGAQVFHKIPLTG